MTRRSDFLAALGLTSAAAGVPSAALAAGADRSAAPSEAPGATAAPSATASAGPKPPSAAALAIAQSMRRFDPKLADDEILTIARGIDEAASFAGPALDPKARPLKNGDEPVTTFHVAP